MPARKAKSSRAPAGPRPAALPPAIAALSGTLAMLADATVITTDGWAGGGVEIILANEKFAELTGYAAATLPGRNTRLLHGPRTGLLAPGAARGDQGGRFATGEGWLYRQDGTVFFASWNFSPIMSNGKPSGCLIGIYRDISESQRLREALLQSQKLDTVGMLASGVAHDFNNLLSVINGYCEIMTPKISAVPAARRDLQEIHRAGLKAFAIARQILEFSRRQETEVKVINFNTLIREIAEILRRVAGDEIPLELRLASGLGNARIDPTHFQQVLLNLCFNARDAMPHGGKLTIRTYAHRVSSSADRRTPEMSDGLYAVMQVTDTGHGIAPAALNSIFEPFFTTKAHGTGLGLPTVLGIIRQNDGHVTVASTPGQGTTFEVFLPETAEPEQTSVTQLGTLPEMRGTETVLVIEENDILRKMIAGILATDGYRVTEAATVEAANLAIVQTGLKPQLLLTHSNTRVGCALVRKLLATNPGLRLIGTSPQSPETVLPDFPRRALVHLPKPFALSTLLVKARGLLDAAQR